MRNTITRSFNNINAHILVYLGGAINEKTVLIPAMFSTVELAEKYIRKNVNVDGKLVDVIKVEKVSALYGMDESAFIKKATLVTERSKDTRNMISKTVNGHIGTLLYMTSDRAIKECLVVIPKGAKLDKVAKENTPDGCKPITIENIKESSSLYVMSIEDFLANAKPMLDHQHYVTK